MSNIKFYTMNAKSVPECLGYPLDMVKDIMTKAIDICIEYEKECILGKRHFNKPIYIGRFMEWLSTSTDIDPLVDLEDRNFTFLIDLVVNDIMYKYEMSLGWWDAEPAERDILAKYYGHLFGYYAHKKQIMINSLPEEEE